MKIEVPVFNDDGSLKFTAALNPDEAKLILQFGLNFAITSGLSAHMGINIDDDEDLDIPENLN